jgi:thiamine pyrophosphokinase
VPAAIVFAAAPLTPTPRLRTLLSQLANAFVVAADAGAAIALEFGLTPHVVIGDLDSVDQLTLTYLVQHEIPVEEYPRDKDATDGQLAIERVLKEHPTELWLLGFLGGPRLDQALANVFLLAQLEVPTVLLDERNECRLLRGPASHTWAPESSEVVSLLPLTEEVHDVRTVGLRWALQGDTLHRGDTRGISNEPAAAQASVSISQGMLLLTRHFV